MYETESFWSVEEIKKMNKAFLFKMNKWYVILVGIVEVGFLTIGIVSLLNPHLRFWGVFMLLCFLILPLALIIKYDLTAKKAFKTNKIMQNTVTRFSFGEAGIGISSERGQSFVKYDELFKILETDTNFYLFIGNKQAYNIIKANCSEELIAFIHNMVK